MTDDDMAVEHGAAHDSDVRNATTRKATLRAQASLTLLLGLMGLIVLGALGGLVYQTVIIRESQGRTKMLVEAQQQQQRDIQEILDRNARTDANRAKIIDDAVARIAEAQRLALAEHNARVEALLSHVLRISKAEADALLDERTDTQRSMMTPAAAPTTTTPTTATPVARTVAPAPAPSPCATSGRSGRCKK